MNTTNPLEPVYPTEKEETPEQKYIRLKSKAIAPRRQFWNAGDTVVEKLLDKMYWKAEQLPNMCRKFSSSKGKVTYDQLRKSLEQFGVLYLDEEFEKLLSHIDKGQMGFVQYQNLSRMLKHVDGLEKAVARRLGFGDDKAVGHRSSLGQGAQVLVDTVHRGKRTWTGHNGQQQIYDLFTGATTGNDSLSFTPIPQPVALSYAEEAAAISKRNQIDYTRLKGGASFWVSRHKCPTLASGPGIPLKSNASLEGSSLKLSPFTIDKDALGPQTSNLISQGRLSLKALAPTRDDAGQHSQDGQDSNTQSYQLKNVQTTVPITMSNANDQVSPNSKLSLGARRSTSRVPTNEVLWKPLHLKKLGPPIYKKRLQEEKLFAEINAVQSLD